MENFTAWPMLGNMLVLGLLAGLLGGLLGVGGSVIIIPGLVMVFGQGFGPQATEGLHQHVYQAAAMIANVAVSLPAARQHYLAGAITPKLLKWMLPMALVFVMIGVWLSNLPTFEGDRGGVWLGRILAIFLVYVIGVNIRRLFVGRNGKDGDDHSRSPARATLIGSIMGTIAGLLGIGGGAVAVPLQQVLLRLPLRSCIGNSSVIICVSATVGAIYKNATLGQHGSNWSYSLALALMLLPSCFLGGHLGGMLTHRLRIRQVRAVFIMLMVVAAVRMASIPWAQ